MRHHRSSSILPVLFGVIFLAFAADARASTGPARLLQDINPTPSLYRGSFPYDYQRLGNVTIFLADTPRTGRELWRTDGTEAGTFLVKDILPGPYSSSPGTFFEMGGALFFPADDGVHGVELWRTDGTEAGTRMVKEIHPGAASPFRLPDDFSIQWHPKVAGGRLYFLANDGVHGMELWRTDGTDAGTFLLGDILPGPSGQFQLYSAAVGDNFFFHANDGVHGLELWKSNGTPAGTAMVKDIYPGPTGSFPGAMIDFQGMLLFPADDGSTGQELWRSDGTEAGTVQVKNLNPAGHSYISGLTEANGVMFFVTYYPYSQLYKTDGTSDGTVPVRAFTSVGWLQEFGHSLIFGADDGTSGIELWISDGTDAGTALLKDINPGPASSNLNLLAQSGGKLFFSVYDGIQGPELWASDGTDAGTVLLKGTSPGVTGVSAGSAAANGTYFFVVDTQDDDGLVLEQLWKSDGTPAGTRRVQAPPVLTEITAGPDGLLLFVADDGTHGYELWKSDGTDAGTALVKDINPSLLTDPSYSEFMGAVPIPGGGERMLLRAYDGVHGPELWVSDGTPPGTRLLKDINPGAAGSWPLPGKVIKGLVFFAADDGEHGYELWKSDGTEAGTVMVSDIWPGADGSLSEVGLFGELNGSVFFGADDGVHGRTLWKSDGTTGGTLQVAQVDLRFSFFNSGGNFRYPFTVGGTLYFGGQDPVHGLELWKSDGTEAGTVLVKDIAPGSAASGPRAFGELNGKLFMAAFDPVRGYEPWLSDGTEAGTYLIKDILPGSGWSLGSLESPQLLGGEVYFMARVNNFGAAELWKTDGSAAGTSRVKDLSPSAPRFDSPSALGGRLFFLASSVVDPGLTDLWSSDGTEAGTQIVKTGLKYAFGLQALDAGLLFTAYDDEHGDELWRSDGTEAGTVLAQDIVSGPDSSSSGSFTSFGNRVFFIADDTIAGPEPWVAHAAILFNRPSRAVSDLKEEVKALHLARGTETGLTAKLDGAAAALAADQTPSAILALQDFIRHVDVLAPKRISPDTAASLEEFARDILSLLE